MGILFGFSCRYDSEALKMSWYYSLSLACLLRRSAADSAAGAAASTDKPEWWGAIRARWSANAATLFQQGMGAGKFYPALDYSCDIPGLQGNEVDEVKEVCCCNGFGAGEEGVLNWSQYLMYSAQPAQQPLCSLLHCLYMANACVSVCVCERKYTLPTRDYFLKTKVLLKYKQTSEQCGRRHPWEETLVCRNFHALPPKLRSPWICECISPSPRKHPLPQKQQSPVRSVPAPVAAAVAPKHIWKIFDRHTLPHISTHP